MSTTQPLGQPNPQSTALAVVTQPLVNLPQTGSQFANFPPEVYNLTPHSNLVRFMRTILGDAGVGQLRKRLNIKRLASAMQSSSFYDLDGFYGSLFGIQRTPSETLTIDGTPINLTSTTATAAQWRELKQADTSYKQRLFKFGQAISYGPTLEGMKLISEAILGVNCNVSESYILGAQVGMTFGYLQANYTYGQLEAFTYGELSGETNGVPNTQIQSQFVITPESSISLSDAYNLKIVLDVFKPATTTFHINQSGIVGNPLVVPIVNAWADSNFWEIEATTTINGVATPNQKPPYNNYSGEQWYYNHDVSGTLSYSASPLNTTQMNVDNQRIVWTDGTYTDFVAANGLLPWYQAILGRYAQDGILSINALSGASTNGVAPSVSLMYFDGIPAASLLDSLQTNNGNYQAGANLDFWCTDYRNQDDPTYDIIEFRMASSHVVNVVSFDVAHFPQQVIIQYFDPNQNTWVGLGVQTLTDSVPSVLSNSEQYLLDKTHPQHFGNGHWYNISMGVVPTYLQNIRIVLQRSAGSGPVIQTMTPNLDANGNFQVNTINVPYSLGVRKFKLGYSVSSTQDLPVIGGNPILDSSADILANPVTYSLYEELPTGPIQSTPAPWRCAPQPVNNAVINYVIDTRTSNGKPQLIDTLFIDPTHVGVHSTLYYSNDLPNPDAGQYESNDTPLDIPLSMIMGNVQPDPFNNLQFAFTPGDSGDIYVDNTAVQFQVTKPWWFGIQFQANYVPNSGILPIIDLLGNVIYYDNVQQAFIIDPADPDYGESGATEFDSAIYDQSTYDSSSLGMSFPVSLPLNAQVTLIVGYDPINGWSLIYQINSDPYVYPTPYPYSLNSATSGDIIIGGIDTSLNEAAQSLSGMLMYHLVLKNETLSQWSILNFLSDPSSFCYKGAYRSSETASNTANAVLRFDPSFVTEANPTGMVGGPTSFFPSINWTSIPGDYVLSKGYIKLPPIYANYIKFEMTNLVAEPYDGFLPVNTQVQTFTPATIQTSTSTPSPTAPGILTPGQTTLLNLNLGESLYPNSGTSPVAPIVQANNLVTSPVAVNIATDPTYANQLAQVSQQFGYSDFHQGQSAARFPAPGIPVYQNSDVSISNKVAFYCGFNQIIATRTNIAQQENTKIYKEFFWDNLNIASSGSWSQFSGMITSAPVSESSLLPSVMQSEVFFSQNDVRGVQFATQQSEPIEVVYDDNFTNSALAINTWTNLSEWHGIGDISPNNIVWTSNNTVILSRDPNIPQTGLTPLHGVVKPIDSPILGSLPIGSAITPNANDGGLESAPFKLSAGGRAWVAIRMVPLTPISNPWFLQLKDVNTGNIVWESEVQGLSVNQLTEYYDSFDIGSVVTDQTSNGENQIASDYATGDPLYVSIIQKGESQDVIEVDRLSVFDESIVWEFSVDGGNTFFQAIGVRNNATGVLNFPFPGNQLIWRVTAFRNNAVISSLQIRPVYIGKINKPVFPNITGPNVRPQDINPAITDDPFYKTWSFPIPRWWFLAYSQSTQLFPAGVVTNQYSQFLDLVVSDAFHTSFTDSPTTQMTRHPITSESFDLNATETATWINGHFHRPISEHFTTESDKAVGAIVKADHVNVVIGPVVQGHKGINNPI